MHDHSSQNALLTRNQQLVLDLLQEKKDPMSAYAILEQLHDEGLKAPPQVYRALEKLMQAGMVHRLESLNAFLACRHPECDGHQLIAFGICETCGEVEEFSGGECDAAMVDLARSNRFSLKKGVVELRGCCQSCSENSDQGGA